MYFTEKAPTSTAPLCSVGAYFTLLNRAAKLHVYWKILAN